MEFRGCRLCLKMLTKNDFALELETAHQNMLQVVIPVINWNNTCGQSKLCQECSENLHMTYLFKSSCLDINKKVAKLKNPEEVAPERTETCGLCCQANIIEDVDSVNANLKMTMHKCFPQMKIPPGDFIICSSCSSSLKDLDSFINLCLDTAQYIETYCSDKSISYKNGFNFDECIKHKYFSSSSFEMEVEPMEVVLLKSVAEDTNTPIFEDNSHAQGLNGDTFPQEEVNEQNEKDYEGIDLGRINVLQEEVSAQHMEENVVEEQSCFKQVSRSAVKEFHCDKCDYVGKYKSALISHMMRHKDPSKTKMHRCEVCGHETKRLGDLKWHMIIHKNPKEVKMYKCAGCPYETKRKGDLKQHVIIHNSHSFKCTHCPYETKNELYLNTTHMLLHKDISEIKMFKCDSCPYETKTKSHLNQHSKIHKNPTELEKYKCNWCDFETIYKQGLKGHLLIHKCRSEIKMHKCNYCEYEGIRKSHLRDHMLRHVIPTVTYDCPNCSYKAKRKGYLRKHMATHMDPSELVMYKCELCTYETKRKGNLKGHMFSHIRSLKKLAGNKQGEIDKIMLLIRDMNKT